MTANIGAASLYFSAKFPDARIFAIEPDQSNFTLLKKNCAELTKIVCIKAALWPETATLCFSNPEAERWALSVKPADAGEAQVSSITIPEFLRRHSIETIHILKLDIEGAERELFCQGADQWLEHVDTIAIELHDRVKIGCAQAFYAALHNRHFVQEIRQPFTI